MEQETESAFSFQSYVGILLGLHGLRTDRTSSRTQAFRQPLVQAMLKLVNEHESRECIRKETMRTGTS